jgi:hypothetical protein
LKITQQLNMNEKITSNVLTILLPT